MVYLLKMVIFHGKLLNNQRVYDTYLQYSAVIDIITLFGFV